MSQIKINESLLSQLVNKSRANSKTNENMVPYALEYQKAVEAARVGALEMSLSQFHKNYIFTAYSSMYSRVSSKLQNVINAVDATRDFYLVEAMLNQLTDDALAPKVGAGELIKLSHPNKEVERFLNVMKKRINLDQVLENITPDLCAYGEYVLETSIDVNRKKGLMDLSDSVDQGKVITLMQDGRPDGYLVTDETTGMVTKKSLPDYVKFAIGGQRIKVRFDDTIPTVISSNPKLKEYFKKSPRYIRVGRSMLYPALGKIKELELLEKLIPATKINKLSQGNIVGVSVPESFTLEKGMEAASRLENMINRAVTVDKDLKEITVEAILSSAGRTRILPVFGEKGRMEKFDYKSDDVDDAFSNVKELRDVICDSIGVPSELIFKSDGGSKADLLKRYAKYLRKLKRIQKALVDGVRQIVAIHLANSIYGSINPEEVDIQMTNTLVEIDNLDKLEHADVTISFLKNIKDFFTDLSDDVSPFKQYVKLDKVLEFMEESLKTIGLQDAIVTPAEIEKGVEPPTPPPTDPPPEDDLNDPPKEDPKYPNVPFDPNTSPEEEGIDSEDSNVKG